MGKVDICTGESVGDTIGGNVLRFWVRIIIIENHHGQGKMNRSTVGS